MGGIVVRMKPTPGPKKLSNLFTKYKNTLRAPEGAVCTEAIVVIDELLGITITKAQLSYSPHNRTLHIKNGMLRSEILPHATEICAHLKGRLGAQSAPQQIR